MPFNNPSKTFGIGQSYSDTGYMRIGRLRSIAPRFLCLIATYTNTFILMVSGNDISNVAITGSKILIGDGSKNVYFHNNTTTDTIDVYITNSGDIYKLEMYNIGGDKSCFDIIHVGSLPSEVVTRQIS